MQAIKYDILRHLPLPCAAKNNSRELFAVFSAIARDSSVNFFEFICYSYPHVTTKRHLKHSGLWWAYSSVVKGAHIKHSVWWFAESSGRTSIYASRRPPHSSSRPNCWRR